MHTIDLIVFLVFTGGIILLGASFWRKKTSADEFTSAGRSLPGWVVGMSIFSTYVSSISYLGYPGKAYDSNWNAFVFSLSIPIASYVAARYFVPFYRRQTSVSAYAFLEQRFGRWARWYASACYLLTQIARIGSIVFLLALPMNVLLGWDIRSVIILTSVGIIFYSMMGGVRGVIWADAIQGIIMIGGALVCLAILMFSLPGGPEQSLRIAWAGGKFSLGSFDPTCLSESTFWVCLVYGIFTNLQNYGIDQNYVQRYHAARSARAARFSALFGGYLFIPVSAVFFLIGTALYSYYSVFPGMLPEGGAKGDYVFPFFIVNQLPVGITGLLIASIFAAGMSTVSTSITSGATVVLTDYIRPLMPRASERAQLLALRLSSLVIGLLGIAVSLALTGVDSILDAWWKLSSIFSGGMLGLFLLGFVSQRVRNVDAAIGVICGVIVIAWISAAQWLGLPETGIHEYLAIVFGTLTIFLVGFLLARRI
ncbi:MAG: sodium:solute symporter [Prevotella sp.]|nr:sodium:solute symporter [Prevotella sp.]